MSDTSDDMLAVAKGSKATADVAVEHDIDGEYERELMWRAKGRRHRHSRVRLSMVAGGGLVLALAGIWFTQRDGEQLSTETGAEETAGATAPATRTGSPGDSQPEDSTTTTVEPTSSALTATCRGEPCTILQVKGTLETSGGEGIWIRSCFDDSPCERRALAAEGQQIYAVCRVDAGIEEHGDRVWVKTPWAFAGPIPQDQPVRADATGESDPNSQEYGWATAYYLTPRAAIDALPLCTT